MTFEPLVVDLDGTLIHSDMLHESTLRVFRNRPSNLLKMPFWLSKGKAALKKKLADCTEFNPQTLPYNVELLNWLKHEKALGRQLILCTASDQSIAKSIADHLELFDDVMASDGTSNLAGSHKSEALTQRFGHAGFDYVGNSKADLAVWQNARKAIVVNAANDVVKKASTCCEIERVFPAKAQGLKTWRKLFRAHQWLKNLLLFIPLIAGHHFTSANTWLELIGAFISFSLCASAVYIINDLLDLESDRLHKRKRHRPFASGQVPIWKGLILAPTLLLTSFSLGLQINNSFFFWLVFYFVLTCVYSFGLKRLMLIDCIALAVLYTLRIVAGSATSNNISLTFWLLAFSVFLFLSLAFVKRYAELEIQLLNGHERIHGRGYYTSDATLIQTMGITSGYASVIVLALYLNSDAVIKLYRTPELLWGAVIVTLFWINWMWMQAHRGKMHDDPLIFALKDRASLLAGLAFASILVIATVNLPW